MFIELHILQNFAPSNLNRDETGSPKSCQFGDVTRARVSSQAQKRAARDFVKDRQLLSPKILGKRSLLFETKLTNAIFGLLENKSEVPPRKEDCKLVARQILEISGWKKSSEGEKSGALQFLSTKILNDLAQFCVDCLTRTNLLPLLSNVKNLEELLKKTKDKTEKEKIKEQLKEAKKTLSDLEVSDSEGKPTKLKKRVEEILGSKQSPDIAMFGRMMADVPKHGIDAASQVAHAISTHAVSNGEFDYFTAVDELKKELNPDSDAGAAMIGTTEFNSACYYRHLNIDRNLLRDNLKDAENADDLAKDTVRAFLKSFIVAVPSGKQNSFASPTLPTFVLAVIRDYYHCSLANAFSNPVRLRDDDEMGLVEKSIEQLKTRFLNSERMYGDIVGTKCAVYCTEEEIEDWKTNKDNLEIIRKDSVSKLVEEIVERAFPETTSGEQKP